MLQEECDQSAEHRQISNVGQSLQIRDENLLKTECGNDGNDSGNKKLKENDFRHITSFLPHVVANEIDMKRKENGAEKSEDISDIHSREPIQRYERYAEDGEDDGQDNLPFDAPSGQKEKDEGCEDDVCRGEKSVLGWRGILQPYGLKDECRSQKGSQHKSGQKQRFQVS